MSNTLNSNVDYLGMLQKADEEYLRRSNKTEQPAIDITKDVWANLNDQQVNRYEFLIDYQRRLIPWYQFKLQLKLWKAKRYIKLKAKQNIYVPALIAAIEAQRAGLMLPVPEHVSVKEMP